MDKASGVSAFEMSNDHTPEQMAEAKRVLAAGVRSKKHRGGRNLSFGHLPVSMHNLPTARGEGAQAEGAPNDWRIICYILVSAC